MTAAGPSKREEEDDREWSNLLHALPKQIDTDHKNEEKSLSSLFTESEKEAPKRRYYYELDMKYNIDTFFYCTSTSLFFSAISMIVLLILELGPPSQMTHYYRYGILKDCQPAMMNLWFCMVNRLSDPDKAEKAVLKRRATYPPKITTDSIWRLKDLPKINR